MSSKTAARVYTYLRTPAAWMRRRRTTQLQSATKADDNDEEEKATLPFVAQSGNSNGQWQDEMATLGSCMVQWLLPDERSQEDEVFVDVWLDNVDHRLVLAPADNQTSDVACGGFPLRHFIRCPARRLAEKQEEEEESGGESDKKLSSSSTIGARSAVSILLESSDNKVLLTRRPKHMRTFPNVWVPPGGAIEVEDSSLLEAGLRELKEEVGIDVLSSTPANFLREMKEEGVGIDAAGDEGGKSKVLSSTPLCLWESVYPTSLEEGEPKRQHCVVYFHIQIDKNHRQIDVKMQPEEVSAFAWLDHSLVEIAVANRDDALASSAAAAAPSPSPPSKTFTVCELSQDGSSYKRVEKCSSVLTAQYQYAATTATAADKSDSAAERISSGTLFALEQWSAKRSAISDVVAHVTEASTVEKCLAKTHEH